MRRVPRLLFAALVCAPTAGWPQGTPVGPEFRVNTYTTGTQISASAASDSSGNFVLVWQSEYQDGSTFGIFGQRYSNSGSPLGSESRVNTYTTGAQIRPSVTASASGDFVVVWSSETQDGSTFGVFGQRHGQIVPVELMGFTLE